MVARHTLDVKIGVRISNPQLDRLSKKCGLFIKTMLEVEVKKCATCLQEKIEEEFNIRSIGLRT